MTDDVSHADGQSLEDLDAQGILRRAAEAKVEQKVRRQAAQEKKKAAKVGPLSNGETASKPPFLPLGYDHKRYSFYSESQQQVVHFVPRELSSVPELLTLAPLEWWAEAYPAPQKSSAPFNIAQAVDALIKLRAL
jgi:hypothetical protein